MKSTIIYPTFHWETGYTACQEGLENHSKWPSQEAGLFVYTPWSTSGVPRVPFIGTTLTDPLCPSVEDLERNDGSQERPYYMPKALLKILGKKNEVPAADKKRKK